MRPRGNEASRRVVADLKARVEALERQVAELSKKKAQRAKVEE